MKNKLKLLENQCFNILILVSDDNIKFFKFFESVKPYCSQCNHADPTDEEEQQLIFNIIFDKNDKKYDFLLPQYINSIEKEEPNSVYQCSYVISKDRNENYLKNILISKELKNIEEIILSKEEILKEIEFLKLKKQFLEEQLNNEQKNFE